MLAGSLVTEFVVLAVAMVIIVFYYERKRRCGQTISMVHVQRLLTSSNYRDTRTKNISSDNQYDTTSTPMSESCSLSVGIKMKSCDAYMVK